MAMPLRVVDIKRVFYPKLAQGLIRDLAGYCMPSRSIIVAGLRSQQQTERVRPPHVATGAVGKRAHLAPPAAQTDSATFEICFDYTAP